MQEHVKMGKNRPSAGERVPALLSWEHFRRNTTEAPRVPPLSRAGNLSPVNIAKQSGKWTGPRRLVVVSSRTDLLSLRAAWLTVNLSADENLNRCGKTLNALVEKPSQDLFQGPLNRSKNKTVTLKQR